MDAGVAPAAAAAAAAAAGAPPPPERWLGSTAWKNCEGSSIAGGNAAAAAADAAAEAAACCRLEVETDAALFSAEEETDAEELDGPLDELLDDDDVGGVAVVDQANGL